MLSGAYDGPSPDEERAGLLFDSAREAVERDRSEEPTCVCSAGAAELFEAGKCACRSDARIWFRAPQSLVESIRIPL